MKKIYFYESNPEPQVWEKIIDNVEGKTQYETPWKLVSQ
ncbi:hypothetical protein NADRNF5_1403 [Nitrosopumilus adriaticus]|uniref:Uncharacterized protein n=1 Tax=Nitrosopumilus adriaticus TaxID=1580092 RepID=A0A0D5C3F2_9ARCH|nr:hypothetical protein NADRNF5_1403 [Nitrosopumilus adriaticus]